MEPSFAGGCYREARRAAQRGLRMWVSRSEEFGRWTDCRSCCARSCAIPLPRVPARKFPVAELTWRERTAAVSSPVPTGCHVRPPSVPLKPPPVPSGIAGSAPAYIRDGCTGSIHSVRTEASTSTVERVQVFPPSAERQSPDVPAMYVVAPEASKKTALTPPQLTSELTGFHVFPASRLWKYPVAPALTAMTWELFAALTEMDVIEKPCASSEVWAQVAPPSALLY